MSSAALVSSTHLHYPQNMYSIIWSFVSTVSNDVCVCVEVLQPSQPNNVMSSAVSLPNHTFTEQA